MKTALDKKLKIVSLQRITSLWLYPRVNLSSWILQITDFSYTKYLATYDVKEQTSFLLYEYITSLEKLEKSLPAR